MFYTTRPTLSTARASNPGTTSTQTQANFFSHARANTAHADAFVRFGAEKAERKKAVKTRVVAPEDQTAKTIAKDSIRQVIKIKGCSIEQVTISDMPTENSTETIKDLLTDHYKDVIFRGIVNINRKVENRFKEAKQELITESQKEPASS